MSEQRTEKATPQRLQKAREKGQFPSAKNFVSALQFIGIVTLFTSWGGVWFQSMADDFRHLLERAFAVNLDANTGAELAKDALFRAFLPLSLAAAGLISLTMLVQLGTTNMGVSLKRLAPSGDKFNPLKRLKDIPKQSVPNAFQALALMGIMGYVLYLLITDNLADLLMLPFGSVTTGIARIAPR
jgi:flagellar biosynthetic protein FlhB